MKLIITRHGETEDNIKQILAGHLPGKLTQKGMEQTQKVALRLKDEKIDVIYSSDLKRAKDTTREIARFHPKVKINYTKYLRETDFGSLTGMDPKKVDWKHLPSNVEMLDQVYSRGKKFLDRIYSLHKNETVLLVCHGGIKSAITAVILNEGPDYIKQSTNIPNTAVSIFKINEDKKHIVHLLNCAKHLDE
jgi:phosphoserine phosphatase